MWCISQPNKGGLLASPLPNRPTSQVPTVLLYLPCSMGVERVVPVLASQAHPLLSTNQSCVPNATWRRGVVGTRNYWTRSQVLSQRGARSYCALRATHCQVVYVTFAVYARLPATALAALVPQRHGKLAHAGSSGNHVSIAALPRIGADGFQHGGCQQR